MRIIIQQLIFGLLRLALGGVSGWLITQSIITSQQIDYLLLGIAAAAVGAIWTYVDKTQSLRKILIALDMPSGSTIDDLKSRLTEKEGKG